LDRAEPALGALLAGDDVDDSGCAVGLELGGRRGEDLDAFDVLGRDRLQIIPAAVPDNCVDGLPSMRINTLVSPRSETMPSGSTSTDGITLKISLRLPKVLCTSDVTW
jgi:hypothetical protein